MPAHKRTYSSGKVVWYYLFDHPSSTAAKRVQVKASGFVSKKAAMDAEAVRRIEVQKEWEQTKAAQSGTPLTLAHLLTDFFTQHGPDLAPKTIERYREQAAYLSSEITDLPLADITALHLTREWSRLTREGGHTRGTNLPRPLSAKTVRNIAGVVSAAFSRGKKWGVVDGPNPVEGSDLPKWKRKEGIALSQAQTKLLIDAAATTNPWYMAAFLEVEAGTGCRRGEVLALRWSDIVGQSTLICRSLCQTKNSLTFKGTKSEKPRQVTLPETVVTVLAAHRTHQRTLREQFGSSYRSDLDLVFANPDGSPLRPDSVSASVSALFKRLKLPKGASLHTLRHTHGSHMLAAGVPMIDVSKRLGHANVSITGTVYSHALDGRDQEAVKRWEEFQRQEIERMGGGSEKVQ